MNRSVCLACVATLLLSACGGGGSGGSSGSNKSANPTDSNTLATLNARASAYLALPGIEFDVNPVPTDFNLIPQGNVTTYTGTSFVQVQEVTTTFTNGSFDGETSERLMLAIGAANISVDTALLEMDVTANNFFEIGDLENVPFDIGDISVLDGTLIPGQLAFTLSQTAANMNNYAGRMTGSLTTSTRGEVGVNLDATGQFVSSEGQGILIDASEDLAVPTVTTTRPETIGGIIAVRD